MYHLPKHAGSCGYAGWNEGYISGSEVAVDDILRVEVLQCCGGLPGIPNHLWVSQLSSVQDTQQALGDILLKREGRKLWPHTGIKL